MLFTSSIQSAHSIKDDQILMYDIYPTACDHIELGLVTIRPNLSGASSNPFYGVYSVQCAHMYSVGGGVPSHMCRTRPATTSSN